MTCKCPEPLESPNPRTKHSCVRCGRLVHGPKPKKPPVSNPCPICGHRWPATGPHVVLIFNPGGEDSLSRIRNGRTVYGCPNCATKIAHFLGLSVHPSFEHPSADVRK